MPSQPCEHTPSLLIAFTGWRWSYVSSSSKIKKGFLPPSTDVVIQVLKLKKKERSCKQNKNFCIWLKIFQTKKEMLANVCEEKRGIID